MFIIIIGTRASGKSAIKEYLVRYKDFKNVRLLDTAKAAESVKRRKSIRLKFPLSPPLIHSMSRRVIIMIN